MKIIFSGRPKKHSRRLCRIVATSWIGYVFSYTIKKDTLVHLVHESIALTVVLSARAYHVTHVGDDQV